MTETFEKSARLTARTRHPIRCAKRLTPVLGLLVAACVSPIPQEPPALIGLLDSQEAYFFAPAGDASEHARARPSPPWRGLGGAELEGFVADARSENLGVRSASARIAQADAIVRESRAGLLPTLSQSISAGVNRGPDQTGEFVWEDAFSLGPSVSWNADLFGGQRRAVDAARLRHAASILTRADVQRQISAAVARAYVTAWSLSEQIKIAEDLVVSFSDTEKLTDERYRAGSRTTTALDVQIARQNLAAARAGLPSLRAQYAGQLLGLDVLLGRVPGQTELNFDNRQSEAVLPMLSPGAPADLLRLRPDVALTELNYRAALADTDTARARLRPSVSFSGSFSTQTSDLGQLFDPEEALVGLTASLLAPIYQGGRLRASVERAEAAAEEVSLAYVETILTALSEVERALLDEAAANEQVELVSDSLLAAELAERISMERYASGQISLLNLLETRRALNTARQEMVQAHERRFLARIELYTALGGDAVATEVAT